MNKVNPEYSLLTLLMIAAAIVVFVPLGAVGLYSDEYAILELAHHLSDNGIGALFTPEHADNFASSAYAYLVSVNINVFNLSDVLAVRFPGAWIVWMLAVGIFRFRGMNERKDVAFLASLIFISSYTICATAYHASPISLTVLFLIAALASLYHWIKMPSRMKAWLLIGSTVCASFFFGYLAPIAMAVTGLIFLSIQENKQGKRLIQLIVLIAASAVLAFLLAAFIANSSDTAQLILGIGNLMEPIEEYSQLNIIVLQLLFSIFPWSIPIAVALGWMVFNPRWLRDKFLAMSLLKQFGVIVFLLTLPLITALNGLSVIMMLAAIYFNVPLIANFLLSQTHNHSITWRVSGIIFALLTSILTATYIACHFGLNVEVFGYRFVAPASIPGGAVCLIAGIVVSVYTLTRNQRTIHFNNRYLYNIVILYIFAQILYKAFINPYLTLI